LFLLVWVEFVKVSSLEIHLKEILWFVNKFCPAVICMQSKAQPNAIHSVFILHTKYREMSFYIGYISLLKKCSPMCSYSLMVIFPGWSLTK